MAPMLQKNPPRRIKYAGLQAAATHCGVSRQHAWRVLSKRFENPELRARLEAALAAEQAALARTGLFSYPLDYQIFTARRAVPLIAAALAKFDASNERAERDVMAGEILLPLVTDLHPDFTEIAQTELEEASAAGDAALRPFIEHIGRRAIFVGKLDVPLSLRLGLDLPVSAENAEHILRAMRTLFADVLAASPEPES